MELEQRLRSSLPAQSRAWADAAGQTKLLLPPLKCILDRQEGKKQVRHL